MFETYKSEHVAAFNSNFAYQLFVAIDAYFVWVFIILVFCSCMYISLLRNLFPESWISDELVG